MPNCVPQSPRWLSAMTRWPRNWKMRLSESPMIVLRRWPTCSGLATFGEAGLVAGVGGARGAFGVRERRRELFRLRDEPRQRVGGTLLQRRGEVRASYLVQRSAASGRRLLGRAGAFGWPLNGSRSNRG